MYSGEISMSLQRFVETFVPNIETFNKIQKRLITESEIKDLSKVMTSKQLT